MARSLGKVDLLGLNSFGQNPGLSPIWGTMIGGGVAGLTTMAARHSGTSKVADYAEGIGLAAGLAASGVMYAMKSTRHAAIGSLVGTFLAAGLAFLEKTLLGAAVVKGAAALPAAAAEQVIKGLGIPAMRELNGFGIPQVRELNGMGIPMIAERTSPAGAIPGVAGNQLAGSGMSMPPVSLLGPMSPQAQHLKGIGGPSVHGLSAAYGATLLGGGR
jgi:hypothetical protein